MSDYRSYPRECFDRIGSLIILSIIAHMFFLTPDAPIQLKIPFSLFFAAFVLLWDWMVGVRLQHEQSHNKKEIENE